MFLLDKEQDKRQVTCNSCGSKGWKKSRTKCQGRILGGDCDNCSTWHQ